MTTHLKTRTIVRCCWRTWAYCSLCAVLASFAIESALAGEWMLFALQFGASFWVSQGVLDLTRSSFAAMAEADVREAVNQFCSGE